MIETVMIFALGFLLASLCALVLVPILNARALRLARRRVDGLFPMSVEEIAAERDAIRANFAVAQRRMERKVAEAQAKRHADMHTLGSRELEVAALARDVASRDASLTERTAEIGEARTRIATLDVELSQLRDEHSGALAALTALEDSYRDMLGDLKTTRRERDGARQELQDALATEEGGEAHERNNERIAHAAEITKAKAALQDLRAEHDSVAADRERLRISLRAAEDALAKSQAQHGPKSAQEDADLRAKITELADALTAQERLPNVGTFPAAARS